MQARKNVQQLRQDSPTKSPTAHLAPQEAEDSVEQRLNALGLLRDHEQRAIEALFLERGHSDLVFFSIDF
jgi:hypothetical protein